MNELDKKAELQELIESLCDVNFSKDTKKVDEWIQRLNKIYANKYRHTYSDIFFKLQEIIAKSDFATTITPATPSTAPLTTTEDKELEEKIDRLTDDVKKIRPITTQAQKELDKLDSRLESNKISSITTLTIFSAVVLAFSGGITFEVGMLQGMASASAYRLVFVIALTGFVLFNTIFALFYLALNVRQAELNGADSCIYAIVGSFLVSTPKHRRLYITQMDEAMSTEAKERFL